MIGLDMMMACAPNVAPATIEKIIRAQRQRQVGDRARREGAADHGHG